MSRAAVRGELKKAKRLSKRFFGFRPRRVKRVRIEWPKSFLSLGQCAQVNYVNDKWTGKVVEYFHQFEPGTVVLVAASPQPNGDNLLVIKGPFKITEEGLVG